MSRRTRHFTQPRVFVLQLGLDICLASPRPPTQFNHDTRRQEALSRCISPFRGHLVTANVQHVSAPRAVLNLTPNWVIEIVPNWQAKKELAFSSDNNRDVYFENWIYKLYLATNLGRILMSYQKTTFVNDNRKWWCDCKNQTQLTCKLFQNK